MRVKKEKAIIDKQANVFLEWKKDTPEMFSKMVQEDFKYWKINRFIKDPEDIKHCEQIILKHIV